MLDLIFGLDGANTPELFQEENMFGQSPLSLLNINFNDVGGQQFGLSNLRYDDELVDNLFNTERKPIEIYEDEELNVIDVGSVRDFDNNSVTNLQNFVSNMNKGNGNNLANTIINNPVRRGGLIGSSLMNMV